MKRHLFIVEVEVCGFDAACLKLKQFDVILIAEDLSVIARSQIIRKCRRWHRESPSRVAIFRKEH